MRPSQNDFQYPLSDRGLCNLWFTIRSAWAFGTFSILYRIVGSVTRPVGTEFLELRKTFSILYRIVGSVTSPKTLRSNSGKLTFSILYRIVGSVTRGIEPG